MKMKIKMFFQGKAPSRLHFQERIMVKPYILLSGDQLFVGFGYPQPWLNVAIIKCRMAFSSSCSLITNGNASNRQKDCLLLSLTARFTPKAAIQEIIDTDSLDP